MSDIAVKGTDSITLKARLNEDWLAVVIGLLVFVASLFSITGTDLLGWAVSTSVYTNVTKALAPFAKTYASLGGGGALIATYLALLVVLSAGVATLGADVKKFAVSFTAVFVLAYASWILGSYAYIAAVTPVEQQKFGISWSLKLTNEGGFVIALLVGLVIANFFPRLATWLKEAIRPELYACTNSVLRYLLPRLEILPRIVRSPSQAPKSRPCLNPVPLPIAATTALEMIGPTPGTVIRR